MCARGGIGEDQRHVLGSHIAAIGAISAASAAFDPANDLQLPILADGNGTSDFVRFALGEDRNFGKIPRSEEHTSELQSHIGISYAVFCLKKKNNKKQEGR